MSAPRASQRANATYVMAIAMTVAGVSVAAFSALSLVTSYYSLRSLAAAEDFDMGHGKGLE